MTDKEIKEKYDNYVKRGRVSPKITSILEMKLVIGKADEKLRKAIEREQIKNMSGKPRISIVF